MTSGPPLDSASELARLVLVHGPISRAELGRRLGLSPASLTRLSRPLLDRGLLVEGVETPGRVVGRPAKPLDVLVDSQRFVGVKLTGDQAFGVLTDLRARPLASVVVDLPGHDVEQVLEAVVAVVSRLSAGVRADSRPAAVGVTVGGRVAGSSVVARAPFLGWRDVDLGALLGERLGLPVVVENDVVALVEAEHWFGLGRGVDDFAVVTIGAGVGYGLVRNGRQVVTSDAGLGLGAHAPLDATGPVCPDGHRGCATGMLSAPSLCAAAGEALGRDVGYDELLALAAAGDPVAADVVAGAGRALGRLLAIVANFAMIDVVVLSGEGVGLLDVPLAAAGMREALADDRDPEAGEVRVLVGGADFGAWARGAAAVAVQARFRALAG
ncbi:MarR family transcriptional regulator [Frigoribacterium sp. Leaf263]|uniref:ROK family transcriptional regulator n=1 Tax=Frigoribacterium sp. Leaf263 TaxID=1736313 RepID=UPI0006FB5388|nr:ROK family transcriptional regulator [Frigoribacterium sp. Leaf263]KQO84485.1 MarR family transcriptional regulator [Frigoribacterium sp. Leaf263]